MALTSPSLYVTRRRSSGPSHRRGFCCPVGSSGTTAAPDSHPARISTSRLITGYRSRRSDHTHPGNGRAGEGLPGSRCHPLNVPRPIRREVHRGCKSRLFTPSMAFAVRDAARLLLSPTPTGRRPNDTARFASRYGPLSCSPKGALDAGLRPDPFPDQAASLLPGLLTATRTGLTPAGDNELMLDQLLNKHLQLPGALPVGREPPLRHERRFVGEQ